MGRLIVFARQPKLGEVKRRLAATLGDQAALDVYCDLLSGLLWRVTGLAGWTTEVAVTPDGGAADPFFVSYGARILGQGTGDLGQRMGRLLAQASPERPVLIVGSDLPTLGAGHVMDAFAALEGSDLVLGPSPDGGYWAIGARRPPPEGLFDGVRWSSPHARADTLANATGLEVRLLAELADIDDENDYRRYLKEAGRG